MKNETLKNIETLENRLEMVKKKIKTNKIRTRRMKRDFMRTESKKNELKFLELNEKLATLEDSKNEIQDSLDIENRKLLNI